jgi:hypothetical protein
VGTSNVSEGWALATERKPWPRPPFIHEFVPACERNAWFQSWLELLLYENDFSLEVWLCCQITGTYWMNKHMWLMVENKTSYGEFMSSAPVHSCILTNGFHHEKEYGILKVYVLVLGIASGRGYLLTATAD